MPSGGAAAFRSRIAPAADGGNHMLSWLLFFAFAHAEQREGLRARCTFTTFTIQFATVELMIYEDGTPDASAQITQYGGSHKTPVTPETKGPGEYAHVWLGKGVPNEELEMIIYFAAQPSGRAKLINPAVPIGKEMWGECTGLP